MHFRTILLFSIGLNLVLGIGWAIHYFNTSVYSRNPILRYSAAGAERPEQKPDPAPRSTQQRIRWEDIESDDYATYIQNLRKLGMPETTIRDIIVADVNQQFARREQKPTNNINATWWKSDQSSNSSQEEEPNRKTENEKRELLNELLGPEWDARTDPNEELVKASGVRLEGPVLGELSSENKDAVYQVAARARRKIEAHAESQRFLGEAINPVVVAQLRQEMRSELARILNPTQLEEFLLRYSETASQMRRELRGIQLTPEEFRMLFRIRDPLENELARLGGAASGAVEGRVSALQSQIDGTVRQVLGPERYQEYLLNQDPAYREIQARANQLGLSAEAAYYLAEINREYSEEQQRIRDDSYLTANQRIEALATVEAEQQKALLQLLGNDGFQRWQQLQQNR